MCQCVLAKNSLKCAVVKFFKTFGEPVLHGEVCFEGMSGTCRDDIQRLLFWSNILSGTAGYSYGVEGIWQFNTTHQLFGASPAGNVWGNVPWETAYKYAGSEQIGIGKKFLCKYEWWKLTPAQKNVFTKDSSVFRPYCATINNNIFILYSFKFPEPWANFWFQNLEANTPYSFLFFDPITGYEYNMGKITSSPKGTIAIPQTPIMKDWVMVIEK